jgi:hypothetical protein
VFDSLEKDFSMDATCWDWLARLLFEMNGEKEEAIKVRELGC